jgi:hypothetical protein
MPVYAESSSLARSQPAARTMHYRLPSPPTSTSNTGVLDPYVLCDTCPMNTPPLCAAIWVPFKTMYGWSVSGLCPCVAREARFKKDSSRAESANVAGSALGSPRLRRSELPLPCLCPVCPTPAFICKIFQKVRAPHAPELWLYHLYDLRTRERAWGLRLRHPPPHPGPGPGARPPTGDLREAGLPAGPDQSKTCSTPP